jgi:hypothetical protein
LEIAQTITIVSIHCLLNNQERAPFQVVPKIESQEKVEKHIPFNG